MYIHIHYGTIKCEYKYAYLYDPTISLLGLYLPKCTYVHQIPGNKLLIAATQIFMVNYGFI